MKYYATRDGSERKVVDIWAGKPGFYKMLSWSGWGTINKKVNCVTDMLLKDFKAMTNIDLRKFKGGKNSIMEVEYIKVREV